MSLFEALRRFAGEHHTQETTPVPLDQHIRRTLQNQELRHEFPPGIRSACLLLLHEFGGGKLAYSGLIIEYTVSRRNLLGLRRVPETYQVALPYQSTSFEVLAALSQHPAVMVDTVVTHRRT